MDAVMINLADRLSRERAATLAQEQEIRRALADRGAVLAPAPPYAGRARRVAGLLGQLLRRSRRARVAGATLGS